MTDSTLRLRPTVDPLGSSYIAEASLIADPLAGSHIAEAGLITNPLAGSHIVEAGLIADPLADSLRISTLASDYLAGGNSAPNSPIEILERPPQPGST